MRPSSKPRVKITYLIMQSCFIIVLCDNPQVGQSFQFSNIIISLFDSAVTIDTSTVFSFLYFPLEPQHILAMRNTSGLQTLITTRADRRHVFPWHSKGGAFKSGRTAMIVIDIFRLLRWDEFERQPASGSAEVSCVLVCVTKDYIRASPMAPLLVLILYSMYLLLDSRVLWNYGIMPTTRNKVMMKRAGWNSFLVHERFSFAK